MFSVLHAGNIAQSIAYIMAMEDYRPLAENVCDDCVQCTFYET